MKLLLVCDDYIYCYQGKFYAANREKANFYLRYLNVFEELRLVTRCEYEAVLKKNRVLLDSRIEYVPIPFFQGPMQYAKLYFQVGRALRNVSVNCHAAILRLPSTVAIRVANQILESKKPLAIEVVFSAHDGYVNETRIINKLFWKIIDLKMRRVCHFADGISCVTKSYLQKQYYSRVNNSFSSSYSSIDLSKSFYRKNRLYPNKSVFNIIHVANQIEYNGRKGHVEMLKILKLLIDKGIKVKVTFVGADYFGGVIKLKNLADKLGLMEYIDFIGQIDKDDLSKYLDESDLFVLPTKAEGLPRVIIEAMAKGLPCISTNVSGNSELLDSEFLFKYEDVAAMSDKIYELITSREKYELASLINYNRSLDYESLILTERRNLFYRELKNRVCVKN